MGHKNIILFLKGHYTENDCALKTILNSEVTLYRKRDYGFKITLNSEGTEKKGDEEKKYSLTQVMKGRREKEFSTTQLNFLVCFLN